jgi:hypothetical protein
VFIKYPADEAIESNVTIGNIAEKAVDKHIIDLVVKKEKVGKEEIKLDNEAKEAPVAKVQPILTKFEDKGGIFDLIKAAKASVSSYKSEKLKEMWLLWLNEIESFSKLPSFFSKFCQDGEKEKLIYNLIEAEHDLQEELKDSGATPDQTRFI